MTTKNVLIIAFVFISCQKSPKLEEQKLREPTFNIDLSFDSLEVVSILKFNSFDSSFIHPPKDSNDFFNEKSELVTRVLISTNLEPYDVRSTITVYRSIDDIDYGSYIILYKERDSNSTIGSIQQDSIELFLGNVDSFHPEIKIADLDYDGYKDIVISFVQNTTGRNGDNYFWKFNSTSKRFEPDSILNSMFREEAIYIDLGAREISTGGRGGAVSLYFEDYTWDGKEYKLFSRSRTDYNDDATYIVSTKENFIHGRWIIVEADSVKNE